jgi:hypothetical protein
VRLSPKSDRAPEAAGFTDERARQVLEARVAAHVSGKFPTVRLALSVTDNQHTMISVRRQEGQFHLRVHHMFLEAEPEVVHALGRYVALNDRESSRLLGRFIDVNQRKIRRAERRRRAARRIKAPPLRPLGVVHDLAAIFDQLNQAYFGGAIDARITWGPRPRPGAPERRRHSMKMGSYSVEDRLIRIHAALDRAFVPRFFVEWIVFHEMLHQKHAIPVVGGRRQYHTPAFLAEEASFPQAAEARRWERGHVDALLTF